MFDLFSAPTKMNQEEIDDLKRALRFEAIKRGLKIGDKISSTPYKTTKVQTIVAIKDIQPMPRGFSDEAWDYNRDQDHRAVVFDDGDEMMIDMLCAWLNNLPELYKKV